MKAISNIMFYSDIPTHFDERYLQIKIGRFINTKTCYTNKIVEYR